MEVKWRAPKLAKVDDSLRCHVCKEFYSAPSITTCGHTFCNLCIRRHLDATPRCPICWTETTISQLRANIVVLDAVEAWKNARRTVSELEQAQDPANNPDLAAEPERDFQNRKRKAPENTGVCPICDTEMPINELQTTHIDNCLRREQRAPEPLPRRKMTMPNFALVSEPKLKKMLADAGLSTKGPKQRLQARYREYVHQYNANLELPRPLTKRDLLQQMRNWDMAQDRQSMANIKDIDAGKWQAQYHQDFDELIAQARQSPN